MKTKQRIAESLKDTIDYSKESIAKFAAGVIENPLWTIRNNDCILEVAAKLYLYERSLAILEECDPQMWEKYLEDLQADVLREVRYGSMNSTSAIENLAKLAENRVKAEFLDRSWKFSS